MSHLHNDPEPSPALVSGDAWLHWQHAHPFGDTGARGRYWVRADGSLTYWQVRR